MSEASFHCVGLVACLQSWHLGIRSRSSRAILHYMRPWLDPSPNENIKRFLSTYTHLSIHPSVCPSVRPSIHPPTHERLVSCITLWGKQLRDILVTCVSLTVIRDSLFNLPTQVRALRMSWPHWLHTADVSANNRVVSIGPMHGKDREKGERGWLLQAREPSWCFQIN